MDDQKSLSIPKNDVMMYWKPTPDRRWEVALDYKTKIYLSDDEKEFFVQETVKELPIIIIGELLLTPKILYILPIMNKKEKTEFIAVKDKNGNTIYKEK